MTAPQTLWGEPPRPQPEPEQRGAGQQAKGGEPAGPPENQPAIWDAEPEPRQLPLLAEPAAWEAERPSPRAATAAGGGRLGRRRSRAPVSPDQLPLF